MMGLIRGQICKLIPDLYEEEIVWVLNDRFPGKSVLNPEDYFCTKRNIPLERMKYLQTNSSV